MNMKKIGLFILCLLSVESRPMDWGRLAVQAVGTSLATYGAYRAYNVVTGKREQKPVKKEAEKSEKPEKDEVKRPVWRKLLNSVAVVFSDTADNFLDSDKTVQCYNVLSQTGLACGYHALKNGLLIADMLHQTHVALPGKMTLEEALLDYDVYSKLHTPWKELAARLEDGEPLEVFTLFSLAEQYKRHDITITCVNKEFTPVLSDEGEAFFSNLKAKIDPENGLKDHTHIFLLNTALGETVGQNAHWIVIVLHVDADGKTSYYGADSMNSLRSLHSYIQKLKTAMEKETKSYFDALGYMLESFGGTFIREEILRDLPDLARVAIADYQSYSENSRTPLILAMEKVLEYCLSSDEDRDVYNQQVQNCRLVCDLERSITVLAEWKLGAREFLSFDSFPNRFGNLADTQREGVDVAIALLKQQCPDGYLLKITH